MTIEQEIQTRTERIWLSVEGIMWYKALPVDDHDLIEAKENMKQASIIGGGNAFPSLIDIRDALHISFDARRYYASRHNAKLVSACGLLVDNDFSRIIGNFFLGLNKTPFPTRIFTSEEKALQWLKQYREL